MLSYSLFKASDHSNTDLMIGEIQNTGATVVEEVKITVTFYDNRGYILCKLHSGAAISPLIPGQKSPFQVIFCPSTRDKIEFNVTFNHSTYVPYRDFKILNLESGYGVGKDSFLSEYYGVKGEIVNVGTRSIHLIPFVTFYDFSGNVVSWKSNSFGFDLIPNQVGQFSEITIGPRNVASFVLQVIESLSPADEKSESY